jgi:hypothetical protein
MAMADPIRVANCSGFYGDRLSAAREMVEDGPIDVLTGDWLAELTMLILARTRAKRPGGGFASTFATQMEQVMGACLDQGIKVVSNAGGLDPDGCAEAVAEVAGRLGLSPTIAYVTGDDLHGRLDQLVAADVLASFETGEVISDVADLITANAYLGCWGIVEALARGADIVITGRVTDAAVVCGPAAWHHGWRGDDWDALAGAVVAGHVIECGAQATGGNYSFFTEVPGMARVGFPFADIAADGSSVIGKHDGTGGEVSIGTVTSQLLYEITGPRYLGPDVTTRFDTIGLDQAGPDRVRISGVRGEPPPATLKVAANRLGGYRNSATVALTGLDTEAKAELVEAAFWGACPVARDEFGSVTTSVVHPRDGGETNEDVTGYWRITVKDADERNVGRVFSNTVTELALATIPGFYGLGGGPSAASPYGVYVPLTVPADLVPQHVHLLGGAHIAVESAVASAPVGDIEPAIGPAAELPGDAERVSIELGRLVGARSGDKGGDANLGVFARHDVVWAWLDDYLTVDMLQRLLPETASLAIDRYRFPALRALNFVIHGLLEEGVAASTRQDAQAKSLGEWLRSRVVEVPNALAEAVDGHTA